MPPVRKTVVTIKAVAAHAGVSLATVSYALRRHPKIPEATRQRVQAAATSLGYRPNPRIASLMAHIRGAHSRPPGERIAFVWMHTSRTQVAREPFLQKVLRGARERAEQVGFALEEFRTDQAGMTDRRLEQIIRARGIVGVVLSPVTAHEATLSLDWNWQAFAPAVIGNVAWAPELHHAGHHHYLGMRLALLELAKLGYKRPAALLDFETNERARRTWAAAFLSWHPNPEKAAASLLIAKAGDQTAARGWLRRCNADALIVSSTAVLAQHKLESVFDRKAAPVITLHWSDEAKGIGGIDQCYDRIAGHAVDLVASQLNSNETGVPDLPRMMLFPGRWVPPLGRRSTGPTPD